MIRILRVRDEPTGWFRIWGDNGVRYLTRNVLVASRLERCIRPHTRVSIGSNAAGNGVRFIYAIRVEGETPYVA